MPSEALTSSTLFSTLVKAVYPPPLSSDSYQKISSLTQKSELLLLLLSHISVITYHVEV